MLYHSQCSKLLIVDKCESLKLYCSYDVVTGFGTALECGRLLNMMTRGTTSVNVKCDNTHWGDKLNVLQKKGFQKPLKNVGVIFLPFPIVITI